MPNTTYVLGAGFSLDAAFPLVRDLRKRVLEFIKFDRHSSYEALLEPCWEYPDGKFYTRLAELGRGNEAEPQFEELLIRLAREGFAGDSQVHDYVAWTLRIGCARLFWCIHGLNPYPEWCYRNFALRLRHQAETQRNRATIVSFNWDLVIETALDDAGIPWSYCLSTNGALPILKPHGSINWNGYLRKKFTNDSRLWRQIANGSRLSYPVLNPLKNPDQQVVNPDLVYALFPGDPDLPSQDEDVARIWQDVKTGLGASNLVVFIGYSLPAYDSFASAFFEQQTREKQVEVWNPSETDQEKYRKLLGDRIVRAGGQFASSPYARE